VLHVIIFGTVSIVPYGLNHSLFDEIRVSRGPWGGSVAEWLACWTRRRRAGVQIAVATLSSNSLRQTVHTYRASVHQAAKLVAAHLRVAGVTAGLAKVMAAYRQVYDSHHLQADYQEPGSAPDPTLGNRVCATFTFLEGRG